MSWLDDLKFDNAGLLPVVAQDAATGEILMVAFANRDALEQTATSGRAHYWSRSRSELWRKGDTSGHTQQVDEIRLDCDGDAIVYRVRQEGHACHTGATSCFFRRVAGDSVEPAPSGAHILDRIGRIIEDRHTERPEGSYTTYLFDKGVDKVLKKIGEEATEVVIAAKNEASAELRAEVADLLFHLVVLLRINELPLTAIWSELEGRFGAASRIPQPRSTAHPNS